MSSTKRQNRLRLAASIINKEAYSECPKEALRQLCILIGKVAHEYPDHGGVQAIASTALWIVAGQE